MEVLFGPNSQDEPNLLYKLQHKLKVFNTTDPLPNRGYNLITSSSKYGFVFVATPDGTLSVYYLREVIDKECEGKHLIVKLHGKPTHIAISCDQELLAVTYGQLLSVYKVVDFANPNVSPSMNIKCDVNPSTFVSALQWNPCIPDNIAIVYYDGTLLVSQVSSGQVKKIQSKARCLCWSPKGKQLVTGNNDGSLAQYKPDLTPAKMVPPPNLFEGAPVEALAIHWISTFQFAVVFKNAADNSRPVVTIVNTPKGGQPSCTNFEDICYSMGTNRPWYYYLNGMPQWNIILCASSNSMEMATLGSADGANWVQWCQPDEGRPELPLTNKRIENYPVGICFDTTAIHQLPWGENETLPHMPLLLVVSQSGLLTIFNVINLKKDGTQVCSPPQGLALPESAMISDIPGEAPEVVPPPQPQPVAQPVQPQQIQPPPAYSLHPQSQPQPQVGQSAFTEIPAQTGSSQFGNMNFGAMTTGSTQPAFSQAHQPTPVAVTQTKPIATPQPQAPQAVPKSTPTQAKPQSPMTKESAALKEEQERIAKIRANEELMNMLIKEVNDFQNELYRFAVKTREGQIKLQKDLNAMTSNFDLHPLDISTLRRECSIDELRASVVQLKLELVRTCAVVAETRTHAELKDVQEWTYADPLTTKRIASIKKLAYYIETQLDQAQKALDHKWSDFVQSSPHYKQGRMIRPLLDDVYQPLVKQQEILGRQSVVLRTLRNTLNECNSSPIVKSTSLLRSTPFRNKDPLSKLTKNILNMSIETKGDNKDCGFTAQKLDALRDMLANNKVVKIKPVDIELSEHLKAVKLSYEKSLSDKAKAEIEAKTQTRPAEKPAAYFPISATGISNNFTPPINAARTLFTDDEVQDLTKSQAQPTAPKLPAVTKRLTFDNSVSEPQKTPFSFAPKSTEPTKPNVSSGVQTQVPKASLSFGTQVQEKPKPSISFGTQATEPPKPITSIGVQVSEAPKPSISFADTPKPAFSFGGQNQAKPELFTKTINTQTRSVLKDLLQSKSTLNADTKNDGNTFMGQKICSPGSFSFSATTTATSTPLVTAKPIVEISNMFNKFPPVETKPIEKPKSDETGEVEATATIVIPAVKKEEKSKAALTTSSIVPDVLKSTQDIAKPKAEKTESKENVPEKSKAVLKPSNKENVSKLEDGNKTPVQPASLGKAAIKSDTKDSTVKTDATSTASSIFSAAASKPQSVFGSSSPSTIPKSIFGSAAQGDATAKSVFGSPPQGISIFSSPTSPSAFSSSTSIFGAKPAVTSTETKPTEAKTDTPPSTPETKEATPAETKSIFGTPKVEETKPLAEEKPLTPPVESKPTVFSTPTPASPSSVFGNQSPKPTVFGSSAASIFASANNQSPVFSTATATTAQSVFGSTTVTTQSGFSTPSLDKPAASTPLFAASTATVTTQSSIFGSNAATATTQASVFAATTTPGSIFGTATTTQSVFGSTSTPPKSIFGTSSPSSVFGAAQPVFGATTQASTTQSSIFGTPQPAQSIFGQAATSPASVFGSQPTTTASSSIFGATENLFASASISTTSAPSQSGGSIFGGSTSTFAGSNSNVFGAKTTFGAPTPSASAIFGGSSFGQKPAENTNFWGNGNNSSSGGFGSTGFGQQPASQPSIFGGSGGSFSSGATGGAFSSPAPQGSVFGSPQQNAPAFGGSAGFGSKAAFGQPAGFGSPPSNSGFGSTASFGGFNKSPSAGFASSATFGSGATFGGSAFGSTSPGKVFGGASPSAGFGSTQSNATFSNLATQNTLTFGNLAQQSAPAQPQPAFNTSPSFTGWRG